MRETWHIREATRRIAAGGIIAYPTETIYGLGCDPFNGAAVLRLLALKRRAIEAGLILIASHFGQIEYLLASMPPATRKHVMSPCARPVTWVLPCLPTVPDWIRGNHDSLAFRLTTHPIAAGLCHRLGGPLVSTSANMHHRPPATGPLSVRKAFHGRLDYVLHDPAAAANRPSEIRDGMTGAILRPG
ncbi:MAG TPA: Sua5/YciO/YrdC/YwlC family protein [Gammaproteobacteria bacterium]|nr:Sua5/YciO/YrdC/YwlC family protein [Gammaproteobacteria bacterium]